MFLKIVLPKDAMCRLKLTDSLKELREAVRKKSTESLPVEFDFKYTDKGVEKILSTEKDFNELVSTIKARGDTDTIKLFYTERLRSEISLNDTLDFEVALQAMPSFGGNSSTESDAIQREDNKVIPDQLQPHNNIVFSHIDIVQSKKIYAPNPIQNDQSTDHLVRRLEALNHIYIVDPPASDSNLLSIPFAQELKHQGDYSEKNVPPKLQGLFTPEQEQYIAYMLHKKTVEIEQKAEEKLNRALEAARTQWKQEYASVFEQRLAELEAKLSKDQPATKNTLEEQKQKDTFQSKQSREYKIQMSVQMRRVESNLPYILTMRYKNVGQDPLPEGAYLTCLETNARNLIKPLKPGDESTTDFDFRAPREGYLALGWKVIDSNEGSNNLNIFGDLICGLIIHKNSQSGIVGPNEKVLAYREDTVQKGLLLHGVFGDSLEKCLNFAERSNPTIENDQLVDLYIESSNNS